MSIGPPAPAAVSRAADLADDVVADGASAVDRSAALSLARPGAPSAEAKALHDLTHLPPEPWCEVSIRARGRDLKRSLNEHAAEAGIPVIQID